jgi:hypothetical protein
MYHDVWVYVADGGLEMLDGACEVLAVVEVGKR